MQGDEIVCHHFAHLRWVRLLVMMISGNIFSSVLMIFGMSCCWDGNHLVIASIAQDMSVTPVPLPTTVQQAPPHGKKIKNWIKTVCHYGR